MLKTVISCSASFGRGSVRSAHSEPRPEASSVILAFGSFSQNHGLVPPSLRTLGTQRGYRSQALRRGIFGVPRIERGNIYRHRATGGCAPSGPAVVALLGLRPAVPEYLPAAAPLAGWILQPDHGAFTGAFVPPG